MFPTDNANNFQFLSYITIDKIVKDDGLLTTTVSAGNPIITTAATVSEAHTIAQSVIVNAMFAIDGTNFYPCGATIEGAYDATYAARQYARCYGYANASSVYFYCENGFVIDKTFTIRYALEPLT